MDEIVDLSLSGGSQSFIDVCGEDYGTPEPFMHYPHFEDWQQPLNAESTPPGRRRTFLSTAQPDPLYKTGEVRGSGLQAKAGNTVVTSERYQPAEHGSVERQRPRDSPYGCSLCGKMFGTTSSLNKHLLTHQSDRPHVCSICQRAFKRPDHLTGHMLTHQKRKLFRCAEPGCQRSYCDSHSLKRHCASQHGGCPKPTSSEGASTLHPTAQWEPTEDTASSSNQSAYPTLCIPATKSVSDAQVGGSNYHSYVNYSNLTGFPSVVRGLGVNHFKVESAAQDKALAAEQDQWITGATKGVYAGSRGEAVSSPDVPGYSQWPVELKAEAGTFSADAGVAAGQSYGANDLSVSCWENALDFPVSDLQALDNILSFQSMPRETASCHNNNNNKDGPASSENTSHSKLSQHAYVNQGLTQVKKIKQETLSPRPISSGEFTTTVDLPAAAAESHVDELEKRSIPKKAERVKKKVKKKITTDDVLSLPVYNEETVPWHSRPRPEFLLSPSQVAMASFSSDSAPYVSLKKGGSVSVIRRAEGGQEACDRSDCGDVPEDSYSWPHAASSRPYEHMDSEPEPSISVQTVESTSDKVSLIRVSPQHPETVASKCLSPLIIPVSVPVSKGLEVGNMQQAFKELSDKTVQAVEGARLKKARRLESLKSLIIPSPVPPHQLLEQDALSGLRIRATGGYPSQLRSPTYLAGQLTHPDLQLAPYTPPPMLSPLRPGSGLYFNKLPQQHPCAPLASSFVAAMDRKDGTSLVVDDSVVSIEPRINVGSRFQAEIPPLRNRLLMLYEEHPAQLVWSPCGDIASNTDTQERVTEFLNMCCSSVLPGGGTNAELALHCLHEAQGDILAALDLLLVRGDYRSSSHPLSDYHYAGSDFWSLQEKRVFQKALVTENKDFQRIQKMLQSKTVYQCVEYYYAMKKLKKFKQRTHTERREGADYTESPSGPDEQQVSKRGVQRSQTRQTPTKQLQAPADASMEYTCEECGRGFEKVRSRSAHMKTHRHQERNCSLVSSWAACSRLMEQQAIPAGELTCTPESDSQKDMILPVAIAASQNNGQLTE